MPELLTNTVDDPNPAAGSLVERAYSLLRDDIIHGRLRPNQALVELDIAGQMGISRTPVREALQKLANDGLVISHRRRWYVYEHSHTEIVEMYEVRAALEGYLASLAAVRATPSEIATMEAYYRACRRVPDLPESDRGSEWVRANKGFHDAVSAASRNSLALTYLNTNWLIHFNRDVALRYSDEERRESTLQHARILAAIADGDAETAQREAQSHVEYSLEQLIKHAQLKRSNL